jgi:putative FmdB family regulatory protein
MLMAQYNYACSKCGQKFTIFIAITKKTPDCMVNCPNCKTAKNVKRVYDNFSFILKGHGYYSKDSKEELNEN